MGRRFTTACVMAVALCLFSSTASATYFTEIRKATRNHRVFSFTTWDANIIWHATFFSDHFRQVFIDRFIERKYLDDYEAEKFTREQQLRQGAGWDFFITMYTKKDYKKFSIDEDSFWKIHLTTESGQRVNPIEIEAVAITPYEKVMYPHIQRWSKAYRVTFPKADIGSEFELTLESIIGKSTLKWKSHDKPDLGSNLIEVPD